MANVSQEKAATTQTTRFLLEGIKGRLASMKLEEMDGRRIAGWVVRSGSSMARQLLASFEEQLARRGGGVIVLGSSSERLGTFYVSCGYRLAHHVVKVKAGGPLNPDWPILGLKDLGTHWDIMLAPRPGALSDKEAILTQYDVFEKTIPAIR